MKERCFGDVSEKECCALKPKQCEGCTFYKPLSEAVEGVRNYYPRNEAHVTKRELLELWRAI